MPRSKIHRPCRFLRPLVMAVAFTVSWTGGVHTPAAGTFCCVAPVHAHKYDGMTVREIFKKKKARICRAPLDPGSPSWDDIAEWTWEEVDAAAKARKTGFETIRKLLTDGRYDK